jgi:hypothetical protein
MANTMTLISSVTVGSGGAASIDFSSIPATFTDLCLKVSVRNTGAYPYDYIFLRFNGSSAASYSSRMLQGDGSSASSNSYSSETYIRVGYQDAGNNTANTFGNTEIYIPNYTSSNNKSTSSDSVQENNATASNVVLVAGLWSNTAAINQVTLLPSVASFAQYSTAYLYGISKS